MKSCPMIVTEGDEAANHHSTASERTRAKIHKVRRSDNAEADVTTEGAFTVEASPKTIISKVGVCVNPLGVRALFSTPVFPTGFFGMEFLVRRTGGGS
jgi:hypothetical protein